MPAIVYASSLGSRGITYRGTFAYANLGMDLSLAGDFNGDGIGDFLIGAAWTDLVNDARGATYVLFGRPGNAFGPVNLDNMTAEQGFVLPGPDTRAMTGEAVSSAGDVNGDGFDDFLVGSPREHGFAGQVYVVFGRAGGFGSIDLANLAAGDGFAIRSGNHDDVLGLGISAAGDVNGDGYDDILVGAHRDDTAGTDAGAAYVVFGKAGGFGTVNVETMAATDGFAILGANARDHVGEAVSGLEDINGDGYDDLILGAFVNGEDGNEAGRVYVVFGKAGGFGTIDLGALAASDGFVIRGADAFSLLGDSVSSAGDVNADGFSDMIIGAAGGGGDAYVVFGKAGGFGTVDLALLPNTEGFMIRPAPDDSNLGRAVSSAGDVNGDGYDDLLVGAPHGGPSDAGRAYVIYGKGTNFATVNLGTFDETEGYVIEGESEDDLTGLQVSSAGDVNFDGVDEVLVAARGDNQGGFAAGAAYLVFGVVPGAAVARTGTVAGQSLAGGEGDDVLDGLGGDDRLFGNGGVDQLLGGDGDDLLAGGAGADQMDGGQGDDTYFVDDAGDVVTEQAGSGIDWIRTSLAGFSLAGLPDIENLSGDAGAQTLTGNSLGNRIDGGGGADVMAGGGGDDVYHVDNEGDVVVEGVGQGFDIVRASAGYALADGVEVEVLETATRFGTAAIALIGNGFAQAISGNDGSNVIRGGGGEDVLTGFGGDDVYHVDDLAARIVEVANGGRDTVYASISYALAAGLHVELLSAASLGATDPFHLSGNELNNEIYGNAGANTLRGGGGTDLLLGGFGDDVYYVGSGAETIFEYAGQGRDTVYTGLNHALAAGSHVEVLSAISLGATDPLHLSGNALNQEIYGNAGANVLRGGGGADLMLGGFGDDIYYVSSGSETILEYADQGRDIVYAGFHHALAAGSHVEILSAISLSGTGTLQLSGNAFDNEIYGNAGANTLRGGGGADLLVGGSGSDTYYITSGAETVVEIAGTGRDIVYTGLNYALAAGSNVEILSAISLSGSAPLQLSGNELNNEIYGNAGANILRGGGGIDLLLGGFGDDVYYVASGGETIFESAGQGRDTVYASLSHTLAAGSHVEILSAVSLAGAEPLELSGNALNQEIYGNAGANVLRGGGGSDLLLGGLGDDIYYVTSGSETILEHGGEGSDIVYAAVSHTLASGSHVEILSAISLSATGALDFGGNEFGNIIYGNAGANGIDGKGGADHLAGGGGADSFAFTTLLAAGNVDAIADFEAGIDKFALDDAVFAGLAPGTLAAGAFVTGSAAGDADDRIVYDSATGRLLFDADGNGTGAAVQFASVAAGTVLAAGDFTVI